MRVSFLRLLAPCVEQFDRRLENVFFKWGRCAQIASPGAGCFQREIKNASFRFFAEVSSFAQTPQCEASTNVIGVAVRACALRARLIEGPKAMQVPSILLGESRTRLLQGMAIGAVAAMAIGFSWGGWVTGATSNKLAAERAGAAVVTVLTPICVEKFMQNADAQANLVALRKISSNWQQGEYLEKGGWATRPGATSPTTSSGGRVQRNWSRPKPYPNELYRARRCRP